jgi:hypothetical protein
MEARNMLEVKIVGIKIFSFRKKDIHRTTQESILGADRTPYFKT